MLKGAIDRLLAALALIMLSPLLAVVSLAIKLESPGSVLFRQPRQGLGDTLFEVYKFRTMYQDQGDADGKHQTLRHDPRVSLTVLGEANWYHHVSLQGTVASIEDDPDLTDIDRLSQHYVGGPYPQRDRGRQSARIDIESWHAWAVSEPWALSLA